MIIMKSYTEIISEQQKQLANILTEIKKTKSLLKDEMTGKCFRVTRGEGTCWFRVEHAWAHQDEDGMINIDGIFYINMVKDGENYMWLGRTTKTFNTKDIIELHGENFNALVRATTEEFLSNSVPDNTPIP